MLRLARRPVARLLGLQARGVVHDSQRVHEVSVVEVGPRDGLQNEANMVPLETKTRLIEDLGRTGIKRIEATSFVSAKWVPQLADAARVMEFVNDRLGDSGVEYSVLTPNDRVLKDAIKHRAKEIAVFTAASQTFTLKNTNCTLERSMEICRELCGQAQDMGIRVRGYISCAAACPYEGPTKPSLVAKMTDQLLEMGCFEVSIADTIGVATQAKIQQIFEEVLRTAPVQKLAGHFHDTYGQAIANCIQALDMGVNVLDTSIAGLGGCPFAKGATGNAATEDLVYTLDDLGVSTGIDILKLSQIGQWISDELGRPNNSRAGSAIYKKSIRSP